MVANMLTVLYVLPMLIFFVVGMLLLDKHDQDKNFWGDKWGILGVISLLFVLIYPVVLTFLGMILIFTFDD